jgi:hypothetical protein
VNGIERFNRMKTNVSEPGRNRGSGHAEILAEVQRPVIVHDKVQVSVDGHKHTNQKTCTLMYKWSPCLGERSEASYRTTLAHCEKVAMIQ